MFLRRSYWKEALNIYRMGRRLVCCKGKGFPMYMRFLKTTPRDP